MNPNESFTPQTPEQGQQVNYGANPQPGQPMQYGANPQYTQQPNYGANSQPNQQVNYGANTQSGQPMNYGANPQPGQPMNYGANPQPGQQMNYGASPQPGQQMNYGAQPNYQTTPGGFNQAGQNAANNAYGSQPQNTYYQQPGYNGQQGAYTPSQYGGGNYAQGAMPKKAVWPKVVIPIVAAVLVIGGIIIAMTLLGGGSGDSKIKSKINSFEAAINNENLEDMVKCFTPDVQKQFDELFANPELLDMYGMSMSSMFAQFIPGYDGTGEIPDCNVEVLDIKYSEDDTEAYVECKLVVGDNEETDTLPMIKIDDNWYININ